MRHLDLSDYFASAARATGQDIDSLRLRYVDPVAAMLALAGGGGAVVHEDLRLDTAEGLHRLILGMVRFQPAHVLPNDRITVQAAHDYARNRGWRLDLGDGDLDLVCGIEDGTLEARQAGQILAGGLRPSPSTQRVFPPGLRDLRLAISRPVTDPSPHLQAYTTRLEKILVRELGRRGAKVLTPSPRHRSTASGQRVPLRSLQDQLAPTASTREVMRGSIVRTAGADCVISFADPSSNGVPVEREWSLRLRTPIIEVVFSDAVHPHDDGPARIHHVRADQRSPETTGRRVISALERLDCEVRDSAARGRSLEVKNDAALTLFKNKWHGLSAREKDFVATAIGMSRAYLEGLQSSGRAFELASDEQRRSIELALRLPNPRLLAIPPATNERELRVLAGAAEALGLVGAESALAVVVGASMWRGAHQSARMQTREDALKTIRQALKVIRGTG